MIMMLRLKCFGDIFEVWLSNGIELFSPPIPLFWTALSILTTLLSGFYLHFFLLKTTYCFFFLPTPKWNRKFAIFPALWCAFRSISKVFLVRTTMMRGVLSRREIAEKQRWCFFTYQWQKSWHTFLKQKLQWQRNKSKWHKPVAKISPFSFVRAIFVLGSQRVCHASRKGIYTRGRIWTIGHS